MKKSWECYQKENVTEINRQVRSLIDDDEKMDQITETIMDSCGEDIDIYDLLNGYLEADDDQKAIIDYVLVCLTGYTLESIINLDL